MSTPFPDPARYDAMDYRRCGASGLRLPPLALGLWHNFGGVDDYENARAIVRRAFDLGLTHFDLANTYGPPPGSAEETFGRILRGDLAAHRDELVVTTKAGYRMGPGPYGDGGSRKYLLASLDASLKRLGVDYVDIFYHHRSDPETPLEETMGALDAAVRQGKALYVGLSNYGAARTRAALTILRELGTPVVVHQPKYNLLERAAEEALLPTLRDAGLGCVVFSPLAQGLLTDRYLGGIPDDSRAARPHGSLGRDDVTGALVARLRALDEHARARGRTLAGLALAWVLRRPDVTAAIVGVSRVAQLEANVAALDHLAFEPEELAAVDELLAGAVPAH